MEEIENMGPCAEIVGPCIFNGKLYNAAYQNLNEAWLHVGVVVIVIAVILTVAFYAVKAYVGWKRG